MSLLKRSTLFCVLVLSTLLTAFPASAQGGERVFVLGIRSLEGDDDLARSLTGAIRSSAGSVPTWDTQPQEITLAQMTMVHGCDEPDTPCMQAISQELEASKIVYATLRRTSSEDNHDYVIAVYLFDDAQNTIVEQLTDTIPRSDRGISSLRQRADRYIAQLAGLQRFGTLRVETGQPNADVFIDGELAGQTDESGFLTIPDLPEGEHALRVEADGFDDFDTTVNVPADSVHNVRTQLLGEGVAAGTDLRWIPGAAATAGGLALLLAAIPSSRTVTDYRSQRSTIESTRTPGGQHVLSPEQTVFFNAVRNQGATPDDSTALTPFQTALLLTEEGEDVCANPRDLEWVDRMCDEQNSAVRRHRALYISGGILLGAGVGLLIWWAATRESDDDDESAVRVQINPYASRTEGGAQLQLTW